MKKLKGKKQIQLLFEEGASINDFPLRLIYMESQSLGFGVSVGKRNFKLAVLRNRIKRQMRAAAELHFFDSIKETKKPYNLMVIYTGKSIPKWGEIEKKFKDIAIKLKKKDL